MEGRLFIRGCAIFRDRAVEESRSVVIEGETIAAIDSETALKVLPGDWVCDARGRLLTPGRVDTPAPPGGTVAEVRLKVATALRRGITTLIAGGDAAIATEAAQLGARVATRPPDASPQCVPGARADLVLWDVVPGQRFDPVQLENAFVAWVIVGGRVVVREGQLVGADYVALAAAAR